MKQIPKKNLILPTWLWFLQVVTGIGLVLFVIIHIFDVSTIILGENVYNKFAKFLEEDLSFLTTLITWLVGIGLLYHAINGIRIASKPYQRSGLMFRHTTGMKHSGTWFWLIQVITGSLIVFFAFTHWFLIHYVDKGVVSFKTTLGRLTEPWFLVFYVLFLLSLLFHAINGLRSVIIKLGWVTTKESESKLIKIVYAVGLVLLILGVISLIVSGIRT